MPHDDVTHRSVCVPMFQFIKLIDASNPTLTSFSLQRFKRVVHNLILFSEHRLSLALIISRARYGWRERRCVAKIRNSTADWTYFSIVTLIKSDIPREFLLVVWEKVQNWRHRVKYRVNPTRNMYACSFLAMNIFLNHLRHCRKTSFKFHEKKSSISRTFL